MPTMPKRLPALFIAFSGATLSQVDTGTMRGLVGDRSGGGIPAVHVKITDESTGLATEVATNPTGLYVSPPLRAGTYVVEVRASGFESAAKRVQLDLSQRFEVDFDLAVGAVRSEEHTSELQSHLNLVCRLLLQKKKESRKAFG